MVSHTTLRYVVDDISKDLEQVFSSKSIQMVSGLLHDLHDYNAQIWDLESDIRKGKENELGLEEVGRRAIQIRNINKKRVEAKNQITELTLTGFIEKKLDHASE